MGWCVPRLPVRNPTSARRGERLSNGHAERHAALGHPLLERFEIGRLLRHRADAGHPEVARISRQVQPRHGEQRRNRRQLRRQSLLVGGRQRECVRPQLDDGVVRRALVRRRVALSHPERLVEGRIARPRPQYVQVELHGVEHRFDERAIDLLIHRPACRVEGGQARLKRLHALAALQDRRVGVVRRPGSQRRPLERHEL
jgi:hypothetical protein